MATLYHQVWINASPAKVYQAIATLPGIESWWGPHKSEETPGGLILSHDPGPAHGVVKFKVLDRTKDKRVEWEFFSTHPKTSPAFAWTGTHVVFDISERKNNPAMSGFGTDQDRVTILDFRHSGWDENSEYLGFCNFAWGSTLEQLKKVCEAE